MNNLKRWINNFIGFSLVFFLLIFNLLIGYANAAGPIEPVGVQEPVGIQEPVGPQDTTVSQTTATDSQSNQAMEGLNPTNSQTGKDSENTNKTEIKDETNIEVENQNNTQNEADLNFETGRNSINQNTSVGNVETGNIDASSTIINAQNSSLSNESSAGIQNLTASNKGITFSPITERVSLNPTNSNTGNNSENLNILNQEENTKIALIDNINQDNEINIRANTGENSIVQNTQVGNLITGNINMDVNMINIDPTISDLDLKLNIWNVKGNVKGDLNLKNLVTNQTTGADSKNVNKLNETNQTNLEINQNAQIDNNINADLNTGDNQLSKNTSVGQVSSGQVKTQNTVINKIGQAVSDLFIINVFGKWNGKSSLTKLPNVIINQVTGPKSDNVNQAQTNSDTDIEVESNVNLKNNINIQANTGKNKLESNTVVGSVQTGMINLGMNTVNLVNSLGDDLHNFALNFINIFGNWSGGKTKKGGSSVPTKTTANSVQSSKQELSAIVATSNELEPTLMNENLPSNNETNNFEVLSSQENKVEPANYPLNNNVSSNGETNNDSSQNQNNSIVLSAQEDNGPTAGLGTPLVPFSILTVGILLLSIPLTMIKRSLLSHS